MLVVVKVWMLNGFWNEISKEAESLWSWVKLFAELDNHSKVPRGAKGSELDQVLAAKFLEQTEQTLTAKQRKEALREIDVNNDGKMALVEYLLYRFGMTADQVANAKQGKCFNFFKEYARKEKRTPPATLFNLSHADICVHSHCALFFFCFIFKLAPTKGHAQELAACQAIINEAMAMLPEVQANLVAQRAAQIEHTAALAAVREAKVAAAQALTAQNLAEAELRAFARVLPELAADWIAQGSGDDFCDRRIRRMIWGLPDLVAAQPCSLGRPHPGEFEIPTGARSFSAGRLL